MKVFFRCKRSGNLVGFTNESDIEQLRKHEGYTEVKEDSTVPTEQSDSDKKPRGRPRRKGT